MSDAEEGELPVQVGVSCLLFRCLHQLGHLQQHHHHLHACLVHTRTHTHTNAFTCARCQESGEASGFDEGELQPDAGDSRPHHRSSSHHHHRSHHHAHPHHRGGSARPGRAAPAPLISPRAAAAAAEPVPAAAPLAAASDLAHQQQERARQAVEQREREELHSLLRELTRYVTVQDAMRSLDTVCQDLKKAIKKLDKLLRVLKVRMGLHACAHARACMHGRVSVRACVYVCVHACVHVPTSTRDSLLGAACAGMDGWVPACVRMLTCACAAVSGQNATVRRSP